MNPRDEGKSIKVTDRRMFTADGELRDPAEEPSSAGAEPTRAESAEPSSEAPERAFSAEHVKLPKPDFANLVSFIAEPIALFLGDIELPDGTSAENLELARFHIDLLELLKGKTESNLSQDELALLDDLLYQLRMRFVQKSR